jgi:uncharacterized protein (TIGR00369 family)
MATFDAWLRAALHSGIEDAPLDMLPYAQTLGLLLSVTDGVPVLTMPFIPALIGAPGRLHGGTVGALLELAGTIAVAAEQIRSGYQVEIIAKPINISVDYLREGQLEATFAAAQVMRLGRRVANVRADAWQTDRSRLIASAHMNVLVVA